MRSLKRNLEEARRLREEAHRALAPVRRELDEELAELADVEAYTGEHPIFVPNEGSPPPSDKP